MSNRAPYKPGPGTIAFRAFAHLQTLPAGIEISTAAWAEAIGVPLSNLGPNVERLLEHGIVKRRQKYEAARAPFFWSVGNGGEMVSRVVDRQKWAEVAAEPELVSAADGTAVSREGEEGQLPAAGSNDAAPTHTEFGRGAICSRTDPDAERYDGARYLDPVYAADAAEALAELERAERRLDKQAATGQLTSDAGSQNSSGDTASAPVSKAGNESTKGPLTVMQARVPAIPTEACASAGGESLARHGARFSIPSTTKGGLISRAALGAAAAAVLEASYEEEASPSPQSQPTEPASRLRIALWSDGKLEIWRGDDALVLFGADETKQLMRYLDSVLLRDEQQQEPASDEVAAADFFDRMG